MSRGLLRGVPGCGRTPHGFKLVQLKKRLRLLLTVLVVSACGRIGYDPAGGVDGGIVDASAVDGGLFDGGSPDGGARDGGASDGAMAEDSTVGALDAAASDGAVVVDAGSPDASTSVVEPGVPRVVGRADGAPFSPSAWSVQYGGDLSVGARSIAFEFELM